jgi:hypothetical protein
VTIRRMGYTSLGLTVNRHDMIKREASILERIGFNIPFRTRIWSIYNDLEAHSKFTLAWLYALLFFDITNMYTKEVWVQLIKDHGCKRYTPLVAQFISCHIPRKMARGIGCEVEFKRLTLKRPREE